MMKKKKNKKNKAEPGIGTKTDVDIADFFVPNTAYELTTNAEKMTVASLETPTVYIPHGVYTKLIEYTNALSVEISLLAAAHRDKNMFIIDELFVPHQKAGDAHTEVDGDAMADFMGELISIGRKDVIGKIRCWIHTHPGLDVFWSTTDAKMCKRFSGAGDWFVSLVIDGSHIRCRIDAKSLMGVITFDHVPVYTYLEISDEVSDELRAKISSIPKIRTKVRAPALREWQPEAVFQQNATAHGQLSDMDICEYCGGFHDVYDCPKLRDETNVDTLSTGFSTVYPEDTAEADIDVVYMDDPDETGYGR